MRDFCEQTGKPIAHYYELSYVELGHYACLRSNDHHRLPPSSSVGKDKWIYTSRVVSHDPETGRIETKNTVYLPEVVSVPE